VPESHHADPLVFSLPDLFEVWDDCFADLAAGMGGGDVWEVNGQLR
jgi:hypothetical protein